MKRPAREYGDAAGMPRRAGRWMDFGVNLRRRPLMKG